MIFLLGLAMFVFGLGTATGEIALAAILGVVGTFITQFIKTRIGTSGNSALFLTLAVSGVLGFIAAWTVGEWDSSDIIGSAGIVFSLATIAYRFFLSSDRTVEVPVVDNAVNNNTI